MKTQNYLFKTYLLSIFILIASCSKDDNSFKPSASNINETLDEYPTNGTTVGTVTTNLSGTLIYSIVTESVPNAFSINSTTGLVTVKESSVFDFETAPTLTATVTVTNSSEVATSTVSVTLNNIDDIAYFLTTSKQDYLDASNNEWVKITEEEYNMLANVLNNVTKNGTTAEQFDYSNSIFGVGLNGNSNITIANDNDVIIPQNSYCFAFKYYAANGPTANVSYVKMSETTSISGYENLGSELPIITITGYHFFLLKGNNTPTTEVSYLGVFTNLSLGYKIIDTPTDYYYSFSDATDLTTKGGTNSALIMYQGLSSTQKQWD
ncbi:cadherin repeat domain-containing protein [Flavobacteriaceae bacterium SZ-1-7]|uniref:cadherin repeat domain-containing protein n=1 Tax=Tamlana sedimenti TaxID=3134126 RepID=UPI003122B9E3